MKKLLLLLSFIFFLFSYSFSQEYSWQDISNRLPDFPYDTTIINNGEDTIVPTHY